MGGPARTPAHPRTGLSLWRRHPLPAWGRAPAGPYLRGGPPPALTPGTAPAPAVPSGSPARGHGAWWTARGGGPPRHRSPPAGPWWRRSHGPGAAVLERAANADRHR